MKIVEDAGALMEASYAKLVTGHFRLERCQPMSTTEQVTRDLQARTSMLSNGRNSWIKGCFFLSVFQISYSECVAWIPLHTLNHLLLSPVPP